MVKDAYSNGGYGILQDAQESLGPMVVDPNAWTRKTLLSGDGHSSLQDALFSGARRVNLETSSGDNGQATAQQQDSPVVRGTIDLEEGKRLGDQKAQAEAEARARQQAPAVRGDINLQEAEKLGERKERDEMYAELRKLREDVKKLQPKPFIERTEDGNVANIPSDVSSVAGAAIGGIGGGGPATAGVGAALGGVMSKFPIPLHPKQPMYEQQPTW